jgi:glycosyltransferase involved in cell wall biosynthesis
MISNKADVTINITAHNEGSFLHRTIKCAIMNAEYALSNFNIVSVIAINLDNADEVTLSIAEKYADSHTNITIYNNEFGDLSTSRNFLISKTTTKYSLFFDGDDLFSDNFLAKSYESAEKLGKPCVVSAENIVKFSHQVDPVIFREESSINCPGIKTSEFEINLFVSQNLVTTEIYKQCVYEPNTANYGYEDWHWNTKVIERGFEFLIAEGTFFFYRQKPDDKSLLRKQLTSNTVIRKSPLFTPDRFLSFAHESYYPLDPSEIVLIRDRKPFVDKIEQTLRKLFTQASFEYKGSRKIYRTFNKVTGKTKLHNANVDVDDTEFRGLKKYTFTSHDKMLWKKMNSIEPLIRIDEHLENGVHLYRNKREHSLATAYYNFCKAYKNHKFTDVVFVPWINRGGADLAMIDLCRTLALKGRRVLVITTNGVDSDWRDKVEDIAGVTFLQSHDDIFKHLNHHNIKIFFLRLIQNWDITTVTIMNSAIGFELIERFGQAIKDAGCSIIVHNYAFPIQDNYFVDAFPSFSNSLTSIDKIVVDSQFHKREFLDMYGLDKKNVIELPLTIDNGIKPRNNEVRRRVLFANRIAREKQPQVAIETMKHLLSSDIKLDIYGSKDENFSNEINFDNLVEESDNVAYKGTYSGSANLDFNQYDICFMPSLYEGTPRIVLDAIKAGLYVVCTDVGGMPETLGSVNSGTVLPPAATAEDFAKAIKNYYATKILHNVDKRLKANQSTIEKHSDEKYADIVESIYTMHYKEKKTSNE